MRYSLQRSQRWLGGALLALVHMAADAASPELTVSMGGRTQKYTADALLAHASAVTITVPNDVSYKRAMTYRAVPASVLLAGLPRDDSVRFVAADGFAATIAAAPLLVRERGRAACVPRGRAAGRRVARPQARLEGHGRSVLSRLAAPGKRQDRRRSSGPIRSRASTAYSRSRSDFRRWRRRQACRALIRSAMVSLSSRPIAFPAIRSTSPATRRSGPDLNVPFSPTEYMREDFLRQQIRNPQSVRVWPDAKMPSFDVNALSERDLDDLLAYLYYMAKRKVEVPKG